MKKDYLLEIVCDRLTELHQKEVLTESEVYEMNSLEIIKDVWLYGWSRVDRSKFGLTPEEGCKHLFN